MEIAKKKAGGQASDKRQDGSKKKIDDPQNSQLSSSIAINTHDTSSKVKENKEKPTQLIASDTSVLNTRIEEGDKQRRKKKKSRGSKEKGKTPSLNETQNDLAKARS